MNIFVVDPKTNESAKILDDLRLNKMIIETAQLLSTAMRIHGYTGNTIYNVTHQNHPCAIWARETRANYNWLLSYFQDLIMERKARTPKHHKTYDKEIFFKQGKTLIPDGELTPFVNCTPYKDMDVFEAYKRTLKDKWIKDKRPPKWTNAYRPSWA